MSYFLAVCAIAFVILLGYGSNMIINNLMKAHPDGADDWDKMIVFTLFAANIGSWAAFVHLLATGINSL